MTTNKLLLFNTVLRKELNDLGPLTLVGVREAMETVVTPPPPISTAMQTLRARRVTIFAR